MGDWAGPAVFEEIEGRRTRVIPVPEVCRQKEQLLLSPGQGSERLNRT